MRKRQRYLKPLLQLGLPMLLVWSLSWLLGIWVLAWVAIDLRDELRAQDLDNELALYATVVYGLAWLDGQGNFNDALLRLEPDIVDVPYDIWVVTPGDTPLRHWQPEKPRFNISNFNHLTTDVMRDQQSVYRDGVDIDGKAYRLHAMPTFSDQDHGGNAVAMIITVADPAPGRAVYQAFVRQVVWVSVLLGLAGIMLGVLLSGWSLRPLMNSLRQRERFIAATAHELRTPLAALRSISDSAQQGDEPSSLALQRMSKLLRSTSHTVDDLLLFARLDAGAGLEREALRLDLLVEALLPEDDSITFVAEESVIDADPKLLRVAVRNLLENAHKYGGMPDEAAVIRVTVAGAVVTVTDQGVGFPAEILRQRLRDVELSPTQSGIGLGLAIVNLIARLHGGALHLSNSHANISPSSMEISDFHSNHHPQGAVATLTLSK